MLATSLLLIALEAAVSSDLTVIVLDPSGGRVPAAMVEVDPGLPGRLSEVTGPQGEVSLARVARGEHRVRVSLQGFETWEKTVRVRGNPERVTARLKLARVLEDVSVGPEEDRAGSIGYKTTLTEADLAAMPDDPEEFEAALRAIAGPQAAMRVNGFSGGRLPPKAQIRRIRFVMNPYAAEFHEAQPVFIDIQTKAGLGSWSRTLNSGFRDDSLNARSPLAPSRVPDSYQRFGLDVSGPLIRDRTSLSLSVEGRMTDTARTVRARTLQGGVSQLADSSTDRIDLTARLEHGWAKTHTLRAEFSSLTRKEDGLGIGGFDLAERGYAQDRRETTASLADNGVIFGKVASEARFQGRFESLDFTSNDPSPAVRVMGAFSAGGAGITGGRSSRDLELAANFDLTAGKKHALRFGLLLRDLSVTSNEQRNAAGSYTFDDLASFKAGRPSLFTQRSGDPRVEYSQKQLALYLQDEAKLSQKLTVSGGVRVEGQSQTDGWFSMGPRASLSYAVGSATKLRAGAGRFFDWYGADIQEQTLRLDGQRETETLLLNPSWPVVAEAATAASRRSTLLLASPDLSLPRIWRSSIGFDRNLTSRIRMTADYTYQRGSRELRSRNRSIAGSGFSVREIESSARSTRHTGDIRLNLMPSPDTRGGFFIGYLLQSAKNESDGALSLPANEQRVSDEWGRAATDARHRVFGFLSFRPTKQISMGALIFAESGRPFDITSGRDDNGDTVFNDRPAGVKRNAGLAPSRVNVDLRIGWGKSFGGARPPRPGEGMRMIRVGDGGGVPDTSDPGDPQRYRISVSLHAFNVFNRTNPVVVVTVFGSPFFGQPVLTDPGRRIELGMSLAF